MNWDFSQFLNELHLTEKALRVFSDFLYRLDWIMTRHGGLSRHHHKTVEFVPLMVFGNPSDPEDTQASFVELHLPEFDVRISYSEQKGITINTPEGVSVSYPSDTLSTAADNFYQWMLEAAEAK